ncbi:hypothetical protein [Halobacillus naozhouensis]|uniref:Prenyltransferase and squalene oxidase repeat-containing protein n=1 Tax=Halobacillus naozhouensis TaxID=554880 RepID=A0ABY8IWD2_9BACI|nr:hypothetical protein [Halobacillus naozhouensis]WFT74523.1 hypothetical protein P9989_19565 [Halobacillus naozhouensis]
MNRLSEPHYKRAADWILEHGRELEKARMKQLIQGGHEQDIVTALSAFQNEDGGFGNGLEADIRMPHSSPIATSVAMQLLVELEDNPQADQMIHTALGYLENQFGRKRQGWYAVPPEVNQYPHAFWWTVHDDGMSWIDHHWGNPSAEIIGYLLRYRNAVTHLNVDHLVKQCMDYFMNLTAFESEHEIYCYQRLFNLHPDLLTQEASDQLQRAVQSLVVYDQEKWQNYVAFPLKFAAVPRHSQLGIPTSKIEENLQFITEQLENDPFIEPPWEWNDYMDSWGHAKTEWRGVLTFEALQWLLNYGKVAT